MAEYIKLEDAERALLERCKETGYPQFTSRNDWLDWLKKEARTND